jgi:hypothetical protein
MQRRSKPNDGILVHFLTDIQIAFEQQLRNQILNADATSWKILNNRMVTVADCGSESVACEFDGNIKGRVTLIASIDASGGKLPLWVICRETTIRCESELRQNFAREIQTPKLVLTHQENGWTNRIVASRYLDWLSDLAKGQRLCLLWDCFSGHRDDLVKSRAEGKHITLEFIPADLTDEWQPLDLRIFGRLKMRARALFDDELIRDDSVGLAVARTIQLLLRAWESITQEEILEA